MTPAATRSALLMAALIAVAGCAGPGHRAAETPKPEPVDGPPDGPVDISTIPEPEPRDEPLSRYGNPPSYVVYGKTYHVQRKRTAYRERGIASWYGSKFHGRRTSSGEPYDMYSYTAAHRTLPLPSFVRVTNLDNDRSLIVRVNDRGPFRKNRLIDLSYAAAVRLGFADRGTARVEVRAVGPGIPSPSVNAPASTQASIWLQAGAFRAAGNAERLRNRLEEAGLSPVNIQEAQVNGSVVFRVRVGPVASTELANELARRLQSLGLGTPRILGD